MHKAMFLRHSLVGAAAVSVALVVAAAPAAAAVATPDESGDSATLVGPFRVAGDLWSWATGAVTTANPGDADTVRIPAPGTEGQIRILSSVPGHPGYPDACVESPNYFTLRTPITVTDCDEADTTVYIAEDGAVYSQDRQNFISGSTWWSIESVATPGQLDLSAFTAPPFDAHVVSADHHTGDVRIGGVGIPRDNVVVAVEGRTFVVPVDLSGSWEIVVPSLDRGEHTLTVTHSDHSPISLTVIIGDLETPLAGPAGLVAAVAAFAFIPLGTRLLRTRAR